MKQELKYDLDIQLFAEDAPNDVSTDVEVEPAINLDKLDDKKDDKAGESELETLKRELKEAKEAKEAEIAKNLKLKTNLDKSRSEIAANSKNLREVKSTLEQEDEEKEQLRSKLAEFELNQKKTDLLYSFTEELGITKDASNEIVSAIYFEETSEVSVPDLQMALSTVFKSVRDESYKRGYDTRDTELASGKRRSLASDKNETPAQRKRREYLEQQKR